MLKQELRLYTHWMISWDEKLMFYGQMKELWKSYMSINI